MTQSVDVEPGWYDDRYTPGVVRWFDGQAWTEHTRPVAAPAPPVPAAAVPSHRLGGDAYPTSRFGSLPATQPYATPPNATPLHGAPHHVAEPFGTDGYAPRPSASLGAGPSDAMHWILPVGRSWQSVVAGYVGLVALLVFPLAPVAIGFGVWALVKARTGGHGRGRAVFAIVAGVIGIGVGVLVLLPGLLA